MPTDTDEPNDVTGEEVVAIGPFETIREASDWREEHPVISWPQWAIVKLLSPYDLGPCVSTKDRLQ